MVGSRRTADPTMAEVGDALAEGRRRAGGDRVRAVGPHAVLAMQRNAGNAAVSALMAAKLRSPSEGAATEIDAALKEIRRDEPVIDTVEKGLRAAKTAGVPVDLEGPKPPASALAVTSTGFGPASVPAKKPVPPTKPVPAVHPLGKAAARPVTGGDTGAPAARAAPAVAAPVGGGTATGPAPLSTDQLPQPPVAPTAVRPEDDPAFIRVTGNLRSVAKDRKAHPPAASKVKEAQDAALAPTDDLAGQAKAAKVDAMDAQQAGSFDKKAFITAVKAAIEAKSPKTLKEADDYKSSGKAGEVKGEIKGRVGQGKQGQAADIEAATEAPPDQSKAVPKPVTPMAQEQPGQAAAVPAAGAVPKPAPAEQVNLAAGTHQANQELADAEVTEPQLAQSGEPAFQQALADKQAAAAHADTAPAEFRQQEKDVLAQGRTDSAAETTTAVAGMQSAKGGALAKLVADKGRTKSKDESRRAEVSAKIQGIFAATEADVKKLLDGLDPKVDAAFEQGEATARAAFEAYVAAKMSAYKKDRYGGWLGGLRWAKDKLLGMPAKVNEFYDAGRELYLKQMDGVISRVADIVGTDRGEEADRHRQCRDRVVRQEPAHRPGEGRLRGVEGDRRQVRAAGEGRRLQAGGRGRRPRHEVRRGAQGSRRADRGAPGREQGPGRQGHRGDQGHHQHDPRARRHAQGSARPRGRRRGRDRQEPGVVPRQPHRRGEGRHPQVQGQHPRPPPQGPDELAVRGARGGRRRAARHVRRQGHHQAAHVDLRPDLDQHPQPDREADRREGDVRGGEGRRDLQGHRRPGRRGPVADARREARRHQGDDPRTGQGLRDHEHHHRWHHVADRPAQPRGRVHQGLQADLRRRDVLREQRRPDHEVRQHRHRLGRRHRPRQRQRRREQDQRRAGADGADHHRLPGQRDRHRWHRPEDPPDRRDPAEAGEQGTRLRHQDRPQARRPHHPRDQGREREGQGEGRGREGVGEGEGRGREGQAPRPRGRHSGGVGLPRWRQVAPGVRREGRRTPGDGRQHAHRGGCRPEPLLRRDRAAAGDDADRATGQDRVAQPREHRPQPVRPIPGRPERPAGARQQQARQQPEAVRQQPRHTLRSDAQDADEARGKGAEYTTPAGKTARNPVHCVATILVECAPGQRPHPGDRPVNTDPSRSKQLRERSPRFAHAITPENERTGQVGGFVMDAAAATQHTEERLQIVTRSTGDELASTHAETRLLAEVQKMVDQDPTWKNRVRAIEINISKSPCPGCTDALAGGAGVHALLANKNLRLATLTWGALWTDNNPTTPASVSALAGRFVIRGKRP